ncbi:MAG: DNA-binding response regulator [Mucilaginibacter sp.]|nr:DNA-binding response regulator [Mucilaginibacter sp.]MDB5112920.1 DNA-binding response regulator [Mucilaginibacter sp.]
MKILIVEDATGLRDSIREYFIEEGNICETASDYQTAYQKVCIYRYDCIILDITLPQGSGLDIISVIKENSHPDGILIISAKSSLSDRLQGLDLGADDYLTKPFHLAELKARLMAIVRRKSFNGQQAVVFNEIQMDVMGKTVTVNQTPVKVTRTEYNLLLYFIANKGKVISKNALAEHMCGDEIDVADNFDFIYSHIKNIRKKLIEAGSKDYISAIYGMGYKFTG